MARRPGQLTEEDKLKLQSQGVPPDCHGEVTVIKARYEQFKEAKLAEIKSGQTVSQEVIAYILNTTQNGGKDIPDY